LSWTEHLNIEKPGTERLRSFGMIVGTAFGAISLLPLLHHGEIRFWALYLSAALTISALLTPRLLTPVYTVWMIVGSVLGFINTRIILTAVFFVLFTPLAWLKRKFEKDSPWTYRDPGLETYRIKKESRTADHMKRQF